MQVIREIRDVSSRELIVTLPEEFLQKRVEIIVLTFEEEREFFERTQTPEQSEIVQEIEALSWNMGKKLYTTREQLYER
jgi:hypothetical protein